MLTAACLALPEESLPTTNCVAKICSNLAETGDTRFNTLLWVIYKIVECNSGVTYVKVKKHLATNYGIDKRTIQTVVAIMCREDVGLLKRWRNPKMKDVGPDVGVHLFVKSEQPAVCKIDQIGIKYELTNFKPPVL